MRPMQAITVQPHQASSARLEDVPEPDPHQRSVLVEAIAVGEWDMCPIGQYTKRSIKARHGFMSEPWRIGRSTP